MNRKSMANRAVQKKVPTDVEMIFSVKEIAESIGTSYDVINNAVKRVFPEVIKNGKKTMLSKIQVTELIEELKSHTKTTEQLTFEAGSKVAKVSTELTPSLRMMEAMKMFEAAAHDEIERLKSEKESLRIELDQSKEWYSIKRMEKLNPGKHFNYRLLKNESRRLGFDVKKVFDQNYGEVNAYHRHVWESIYFDTVDFE